jgi:uncharacterized protein YbgA (DUF1722 family)/uncharacterized protein YbbK (DUF523 family)
MPEKIKLGISSCLLGRKVRYDGGHKLDHFLLDTLGKFVEWVPVCPEVESGLPVPREAMRLVGSSDAPHLVTIRTGADHTSRLTRWAEGKLPELEEAGLCGFVFKSRSPSSGIRDVKIYTPAGVPSQKGAGIFGKAFVERFPLLPAEDDGRLNDPMLRENFIERVFVFKRWRELLVKGLTVGSLVTFHSDQKLLILSHSPVHYRSLGLLVAHAKERSLKELQSTYITTLMEGLRLISTPAKNANVLHHIMGYFKKSISADEKEELLEIIGNYRKGLIPLIVPVVLLNHYVRAFDVPYLKRQYYLNPHPLELMLRNHV